MSSTIPAGKSFFDRIPSKSNTSAEECKTLYDEWAKTYNDDLTDPSQGYVAPAQAAQVIKSLLNDKENQVILDAGCGTGLSGIAVKGALGSTTTIDGIDISTGMLEVAAKTGVYRNLTPANLAEPMETASDTYDVVVCLGTLTAGHVGPVPALSEFIRVSRSGGLVVATIKESVWTSDGYEAEVRRLEKADEAILVSEDAVPYREGQGVKAKMLVMRRV